MRHRPRARGDGAQPRADAVPTQPRDLTEFGARTERVADSTYIVAVTGEIDLFTGPPFSTALHGALDAGAAQLIVDLSECAFIDSTGISILFRANERRNDASRPVAVVANHPNVLQVLQITGLDAILRLCPSRSEALTDGGRD